MRKDVFFFLFFCFEERISSVSSSFSLRRIIAKNRCVTIHLPIALQTRLYNIKSGNMTFNPASRRQRKWGFKWSNYVISSSRASLPLRNVEIKKNNDHGLFEFLLQEWKTLRIYFWNSLELAFILLVQTQHFLQRVQFPKKKKIPSAQIRQQSTITAEY